MLVCQPASAVLTGAPMHMEELCLEAYQRKRSVRGGMLPLGTASATCLPAPQRATTPGEMAAPQHTSTCRVAESETGEGGEAARLRDSPRPLRSTVWALQPASAQRGCRASSATAPRRERRRRCGRGRRSVLARRAVSVRRGCATHAARRPRAWRGACRAAGSCWRRACLPIRACAPAAAGVGALSRLARAAASEEHTPWQSARRLRLGEHANGVARPDVRA